MAYVIDAQDFEAGDWKVLALLKNRNDLGDIVLFDLKF